jgi:putative FmdB family regulatory protein
MPTYDYVCDECENEDEFVISLKDFDIVEIFCELCDTKMRRLISPVATLGIVFSNAIHSEQLGRTFNSNAELRKYQEESGTVAHSGNDPDWRRHKDWAREKAEAAAKKRGYRDLDDLNVKRKAEKVKKRQVKAEAR